MRILLALLLAGVASAASAAPPVRHHHGNDVPVTREVAERLRAIAAREPGRDGRVFMKIGDSLTVNCESLCCFSAQARRRVDLGGRRELQRTLAHFDQVVLPGPARSWNRQSLAAAVGVGSSWALDAAANKPALQELTATNARFALVLLGTNDIGGATVEYWLGPRALRAAARNFLELTQALSERGVVPLLTYIPPVVSEPYREWLTPAFNAVVRGVAAAQQVPTIDFYSDVAALGKRVLASDGLHPDAHPAGGCVLTPEGLQHGHNVRNLRTLQALDKVQRVVVEGAEAPDPDTPPVSGAGSLADPVQVPGLPFASRVELRGGRSAASDYSHCGNHAGADGPERVYRLRVSEPTPVRALVLPPTGACEPGRGAYTGCDASQDVNLTLYRDRVGPQHCLASHSTMVERLLEPDVTYYLVVDSFAVASPDFAILSVHRCHPGDRACQRR